MACEYVEDCGSEEPCYEREIDCQCGCPGGNLDPSSKECRCKDEAECPAGQDRQNDCTCACPAGKEECGGECVDPCPAGQERNPEDCSCNCPPDKELCGGECVDKCPGGQERIPETCGCNCPGDQELCGGNCVEKCQGGRVRNETTCACECPADEEICNGECAPKCVEPEVRNPLTCACGPACPPCFNEENGKCNRIPDTCENGKVQAVIDGECSCACPPDTTENEEGQCVPNPPGSSGGGNCFPPPTPPPGTPLQCPDGTQYGIVTYPTFNPATCSWTAVPFIWGTCSGGSSGTGGGSSGSAGPCCENADPGPLELTDICGARVATKITNFTPPCAAYYANWEWCEECLGPGLPVLKKVDTYILNPATCSFDLFGGGGGELPCPTSSSGQSSSSAQSSSSELSSSSAESSSSESSASSSSSSSSSLSSCAVEPMSVVFGVSGNGQVLNQFGPGDTATVTVQFSDIAVAARNGASWTLTANNETVLNFAVTESDPNPRTFSISSEDLLATIGLDFATAPNGNYVFDFCGILVNCAGTVEEQCNGSITVRVRNSSSSSQSSSSQSSSSPSSSSQSSSSQSSSSCAAEPVSIGFSVSSNGQFLNQFGPGHTATVTVLVSDTAAAERSGVSWTLRANGISLLNYTVADTDPNPRTFVISSEDLLGLLGLTFASAPNGDYPFDFCGTAVNCAGTEDEMCNGSITVRVRNNSSSSSSSSGQSSSSSSCGPLADLEYTLTPFSAPLDDFGPGDTALIALSIPDASFAASTNTVWTLRANGLTVQTVTIEADTPDPTLLFISSEDLLGLFGLTFATAAPGNYVFDFCATTTNCAGTSPTQCNGSIVVKVRPGSSASSGSSSAAPAASSSSSNESESSLSSSSGPELYVLEAPGVLVPGKIVIIPAQRLSPPPAQLWLVGWRNDRTAVANATNNRYLNISYQIEMSADAGATWAVLGTRPWTLSLYATQLFTVDQTGLPFGEYCFRVRAYVPSTGQIGPYSDVICVTRASSSSSSVSSDAPSSSSVESSSSAIDSSSSTVESSSSAAFSSSSSSSAIYLTCWKCVGGDPASCESALAEFDPDIEGDLLCSNYLDGEYPFNSRAQCLYNCTASSSSSSLGCRVEVPINVPLAQCEVAPNIATITNPFSVAADIVITGTVNDDIFIDGVVYEDGLHEVVDSGWDMCNGVNGAHNVSYTRTLAPGESITIGARDNYIGGGINVVAVIDTCVPSSSSSAIGYYCVRYKSSSSST